jgi:hypothetical protein
MNYWIVNHKYSNWINHKDLIGLPVKMDNEIGKPLKDSDGKLVPKNSTIEEVSIGDKLAYYYPAPKQVVIGLFKIIDGPRNPGYFTNDWEDNIHFKIEPIYSIEEEKGVSYYDLVENLNFFRDSDGEPVEGRAAAVRMIGTLKKIDEEDFEKIESLYNKEVIEIPQPSDDNLHLNMIKTTHLQASIFQCFSYVGSQERNRVNGLVNDNDDEKQISILEELPSRIKDIGI